METKCWPDSSSDERSDDEGCEPVPCAEPCRCIRDSTETSLPMTQKRRCEAYFGIHKDKEALLEEVHALSEALQDQKFHFHAHQDHHKAVDQEHRRLENQIEFLEALGLEATRSGTLTKLKSKLKGCTFRLMELETTCATNASEVRRLKRDTQFMKTQEATVQRDLYALEVRRLQRFLFHLNILHKKVVEDKNKAVRCKGTIMRLTTKTQELETSVNSKQKSLDAMPIETAEWAAKESAARTFAARETDRFKTLQDDSKSIMDLLLKEKLAKGNFITLVNTLSHEVRLVEKENREKERDVALESSTVQLPSF